MVTKGLFFFLSPAVGSPSRGLPFYLPVANLLSSSLTSLPSVLLFLLSSTFFLFFLFIGHVFFISDSCMGDTLRRRCHLMGWVSLPGGGRVLTHLPLLHASQLPSEHGRQVVLSCPVQPTDQPVGRQAAGSKCQVLIWSCLLLPRDEPPGRKL